MCRRGEKEPYDLSKTEAKLQSAEEKRAELLRETQEKGAAEVAKVLPNLLSEEASSSQQFRRAVVVVHTDAHIHTLYIIHDIFK